MLETQIIEKAKELGFVSTGFASVGSSETIEYYKQWLSSGKSADMGYLHKRCQEREDPRNIVPSARSVIAVSARYPVNPEPGKGFSYYSLNQDYHDAIRSKLKELADFIGKIVPLKTARICVDSAPLLEREWAERAGIGWRGKQGQIISEKAGACIVLGFILTDIELKPSKRIPNHCGDCRKCVESCPTGALGKDGSVDARKCIAYLTIEHKGEIPPELAKKMGCAIFGCDFCTAVCPWNENGNDLVMSEFRKQKEMPSAEEILKMSEKDFSMRFAGTAIYRTGLDCLKRNAKIAISS